MLTIHIVCLFLLSSALVAAARDAVFIRNSQSDPDFTIGCQRTPRYLFTRPLLVTEWTRA